jgi:hypothetical protein
MGRQFANDKKHGSLQRLQSVLLLSLNHQILVARDGFELNYTPGFPLATVLMPHPAQGCVSL